VGTKRPTVAVTALNTADILRNYGSYFITKVTFKSLDIKPEVNKSAKSVEN